MAVTEFSLCLWLLLLACVKAANLDRFSDLLTYPKCPADCSNKIAFMSERLLDLDKLEERLNQVVKDIRREVQPSAKGSNGINLGMTPEDQPHVTSFIDERMGSSFSTFQWNFDSENRDDDKNDDRNFLKGKINPKLNFLKKPWLTGNKCQNVDPCVVSALSYLNNTIHKMSQNLSDDFKRDQKLEQRVDELEKGSEAYQTVIDFKEMRKKIVEQELAFRQFKNIMHEIQELEKEDFTNPRFEENYPTLFTIVYMIKDLLDGKKSKDYERELQETDSEIIESLKFALAQAGRAIRDLEKEVEDLKQMKYSIYVLSSQMMELKSMVDSMRHQHQEQQQQFLFDGVGNPWPSKGARPLNFQRMFGEIPPPPGVPHLDMNPYVKFQDFASDLDLDSEELK